jgi:hypothetical protein
MLKSCSRGHHGQAGREVKRMECRTRAAPPVAEGRTRSPAIESASPNGHMFAMTTSRRQKKYLVVSASLLTRS